jgi:hypothetical protein
MSAAQQYKDLIAEIGDASGERREREAVLVTDLRRRFGSLDDRMRRIGERVAMSTLAVRTHWETALEAMWSEQWMTVPPFPRPDRAADPARLAEYEQEMYAAHQDLMALVQRSMFGFRR